ncbi:MAG: hypothetical protein ACI9OJ_002917 [Myxococcota bacterium]|jgi:hypothetical protein
MAIGAGSKFVSRLALDFPALHAYNLSRRASVGREDHMRDLSLGGLCASMLLLGLPSASAQDARWYQLPANPVWIDIPSGWSVGADVKLPALSARHSSGARLFVAVSKSKNADEALDTAKTLLKREYPEVTLKAKGKDRLAGFARLDKTKLIVDVEITRLSPADSGGPTLVVAAAVVRPRSAGRSVKSVHKRALKSATHGWERPAGGTFSIGTSGLSIRQPKVGWSVVLTVKPAAVEFLSADGRSGLRLSQRSGEPAGALAGFARAFSQAGMTWTADEPWRPKGVAKVIAGSGIRRTGRVTVDENGKSVRYAVVLAAVKVGGGVVVAVTTATGGTVDTMLAASEEILATLTGLEPQ